MCFDCSPCLLFFVLFLENVFLFWCWYCSLYLVLVRCSLFLFFNVLWVSIGFVRCPWSCFRSKKSNGKQRTRIWKNKNNTNLQDHSRTNQQRKNQARIKNLELRTHSVTKNIQQHTDKKPEQHRMSLCYYWCLLFCFVSSNCVLGFW